MRHAQHHLPGKNEKSKHGRTHQEFVSYSASKFRSRKAAPNLHRNLFVVGTTQGLSVSDTGHTPVEENSCFSWHRVSR